MTSEEYKKRRLAKKYRKGHNRNNFVYGMGVRVSNPAADSVPYPRIRSARRFIKLADGVNNLTFLYEAFAFTGYGCKKVIVLDREPETLLERYGEKLCVNRR